MYFFYVFVGEVEHDVLLFFHLDPSLTNRILNLLDHNRNSPFLDFEPDRETSRRLFS